jgi:hypothetical protein
MNWLDAFYFSGRSRAKSQILKKKNTSKNLKKASLYSFALLL